MVINPESKKFIKNITNLKRNLKNVSKTINDFLTNDDKENDNDPKG